MLRKELFRGIAAGVMIGIGGAVYLSCANKYIGAILFSVALLTICFLSFSLFTGKVGFIVEDRSKDNILGTLICLLGNFIGTGFCAMLVYLSNPKLSETAHIMCEEKLGKSFGEVICGAVLCGVLMFVAVKTYRVKNTVAGILFCVPVFILSGFEHSIADMFYFWISGIYTAEVLMFIALVILGNAVGGCLLPVLIALSGGKDK